jgi:N-acetylmuramoyl-L-alanine amidase
MKRLLLALLPWMALTTATAQVRHVEVAYTHFGDTPQKAFRLGDEVFVPTDALAAWGWKAVRRGEIFELEAEGRKFSLPSRDFSGTRAIPFLRALEQIGGSSSWVVGSDKLEVFGAISSITLRDGKISVGSSMQVRPNAFYLANPHRLVLDIDGARLTRATMQELEGTARVSQFKPNTVRIVVEPGFVPELPPTRPVAGQQIEFQVRAASMAPVTRPPVQPPVLEGVTPPPPPVAILDPLPAIGDPLDLRVDSDTPARTQLGVRLPRVLGEVRLRRPDPVTLEVVLPGASLRLPDDFKLATDAVARAETRAVGADTVLTLHLPRPMGAELWTEGPRVGISLIKPNVGDGRLAGKVIVVDPGHGGTDPGARAGNVSEKNLTLAISKLLTDELAAQGATVIMTRKTDVAVSLGERANIANRNNADLFLSVHINSTAGRPQTGVITFHHRNSQVSKLLAECINREIAKVSKLPDLGVWSDGRIYQNGFAVLRNTKMPGVLLELGFINHPTDRARMVTADFQKSVAQAVVRGVRVYLGDAKAKEEE